METITLDLAVWAALGGTIVPILVGLVTKLHASSAVKGVVNLVLSTVAGLIATALATDGVLTRAAVVAAFLALMTSVATYYGVLKPVGVTGVVQESTAGFGLGSATHRPTKRVVST